MVALRALTPAPPAPTAGRRHRTIEEIMRLISPHIPVDPEPAKRLLTISGDVIFSDGINLSIAEVSRGIAGLRDSVPGMSIVSTGHGVHYTLQATEVVGEHRRRFRSARRIIDRDLRGNLLPYVRDRNPSAEGYVKHLLEGMLRDIDFALTTTPGFK